eukprot:1137446-Pelagomonas_calceolata.AAC.13
MQANGQVMDPGMRKSNSLLGMSALSALARSTTPRTGPLAQSSLSQVRSCSGLPLLLTSTSNRLLELVVIFVLPHFPAHQDTDAHFIALMCEQASQEQMDVACTRWQSYLLRCVANSPSLA